MPTSIRSLTHCLPGCVLRWLACCVWLFRLIFYHPFAVAIIGCGSSVFHPEASRVAQMASGGRKSLAQSIFQVGGNGGSAIGPLLAALIILPYGQHAVGWFAVAALLASAILVRVGSWYSLMLASAGALKRARQTVACNLSESRIRWALAILVIMIFSKYFFNACMTSYFTFS